MPRLLIVDDEQDIRDFSRNFFRKRGIEAAVAANGVQALEEIAREEPELVLLDIRMPEMSGVEVLRELRRQGRAVKAIMISGIANDDIVREATSLGSVGFIHKPLVLEELKTIVLGQLGL